jgi:hypothetical protein
MENEPVETVEWSGEFQELNPAGAIVCAGVGLALAVVAGWIIWRIARRKK